MSERTLIELLYGKGAHANPVACVEDLSADLAGRRVENLPHTIWQIVWHVNFWTDYDLRRIHGEQTSYPDHSSETWPANDAPSSESAWKSQVAGFAEQIGTLAKLAQGNPDELNREVPAMHPTQDARTSTVVAILWQTATHNSYHVGQIVLLRRALGAWPPLGGGDSW